MSSRSWLRKGVKMTQQKSLSTLFQQLGSDPEFLDNFLKNPNQYLSHLTKQERERFQSLLATIEKPSPHEPNDESFLTNDVDFERDIATVPGGDSLVGGNFYMGGDEGSTIYQLYSGTQDPNPNTNFQASPSLSGNSSAITECIPLENTQSSTQSSTYGGSSVDVRAVQLYPDTDGTINTIHDVQIQYIEVTINSVPRNTPQFIGDSLTVGNFFVSTNNGQNIYQLFSTLNLNTEAILQRIPLSPPVVSATQKSYHLRRQITQSIGAAQIYQETNGEEEIRSYYYAALGTLSFTIDIEPRGPFISNAYLSEGGKPGLAQVNYNIESPSNYVNSEEGFPYSFSGDIEPFSRTYTGNLPTFGKSFAVTLTKPSGGNIHIKAPGGHYRIKYTSADYDGTMSK